MAPARHPSASASAGSAPRANDASTTPSNASPAPVGSSSVIGVVSAVVAHAVDDEHGAAVAQLHRRQPVSLPEPLGRIRSVGSRERARLLVVGEHRVRRGGRLEEPIHAERLHQRPGRRLDADPGCLGPLQRRHRGVMALGMQQEVAGHQDGARLDPLRQIAGRQAGVRPAVGDHRTLPRFVEHEHRAGGRGGIDRDGDVDTAVGESAA